MRLAKAELAELELPLVEPFETSFGVERRRRFLVVRLQATTGAEGYGECVAAALPLYSGESLATASWLLARQLLPRLFRDELPSPEAYSSTVDDLRGNRMAKSAAESALWALWAEEDRRSLARTLGGRQSRVEVGVSVGIQPDIPTLVRRVGSYLSSGYRRVKLKVKPGWDAAPVRAVRREFPDVRLWVDANQAYRPSAAARIASWAHRESVEQVEQPFAERNMLAHQELAQTGGFRVCLDESVVDEASLDEATERGALSSLNVKSGRVGGLGNARSLARRARRRGVHAWVGGMLESGLGRAHNLALASRTEFDLPGDISASDRYYAEDLIEPPLRLGPSSTIEVPRGPGLGVEVNPRIWRKALRKTRSFTQSNP